MDRGRALASAAVVVLGALAGLLLMGEDAGPPQAPPVSLPSDPMVAPVAPTSTRSADAQPAATPAAPSPTRAGPVAPHQAAVESHAEVAAPRWREAAKVLGHADPPVYAQISVELARRLDSAAEDGIDAPHLQELLVEERQLVEHLKRRYEGVPELQRKLSIIEDSLTELEESLPPVGPSPDPRERAN